MGRTPPHLCSRTLPLLGLLALACGDPKPDDSGEITTDCDGQPAVLQYMDVDGDGWGDDATVQEVCEIGAAWVGQGGDCDDRDAAVHPGAEELCNEADDDCDGDTDEDLGETWFADADGDGFGDPDSALAACEAPAGWVLDGTDCHDGDPAIHPGAVERCNAQDDDCDEVVDEGFDEDADGWPAGEGCEALGETDCDDGDEAVHPDAEEICGDGVDADCSGSDLDCALDGAESLVGADATVQGLGANHWSARALAVGDVDGDGRDDLLVGAMGYDAFTGAAGLSLGPLADVSAFGAGALMPGAEASSGAGRDVALGDVDGDGLADLLVGAPYTTAQAPGGRAALLYGPVSGTRSLGDAEAFLFGATSGELAGHAVSLGDMDGDGLADLAVSSYSEAALSGGGGAVFVQHGALEGDLLGSDAQAILLGLGDPGYTGHALRAGTDFDGDGLGDLLIAALGDTGLAADGAGVIYLASAPFAGSASLADATAILVGEAANDFAGMGLAAGDIDGDGTPDVLAGAPSADGAAPASGRVYAVLGPVDGARSLAEASLSILGGLEEQATGSALVVHDLDGDGQPDLVVGASGDGSAGAGAGAACLFYGPLSSGTMGLVDADRSFTGDDPGDGAGGALTVGDLDGDGAADLVIGAGYDSGGAAAAGAAFLLLGGL